MVIGVSSDLKYKKCFFFVQIAVVSGPKQKLFAL